MSELDVIENSELSQSGTISRMLQRNRKKDKKDIDYDALRQFVERLRSDIELAKNSVDTSSPYVIDLISKINLKLNEANNGEITLDGKWNLAYHAEKLILSILDSDRQRIELHRRFNECERIQAPFTSFYEKRIKKLNGEADSLDPCFHLLISLVSDMQHYNSNKHIKMRYARHAIYRVGLVFGLALTFFLSMTSFFHWV